MLVAVIVAVAVGLLAGAAIGRTLGARHHSDATPRSAPVSDPGAASPPGEQVTAGAQQPAEGVGDFGPLAEAVERISQGIVVMDGEGVVVYRNAMARRIAVSRHSRSLVEECVQRLLEDAREGQSHSETVELFGPPAELFGVSAHPFRDGSGIGAMAVVEDHSEIRRTETVRRDFVANISHELKTPIGALGLLAETIEDEDDPEVMKRLAERMVTESDRAARTIDELLELSRIEFADDMEATPVRLVEVAGEVESRIRNAAEQAGISIVVAVNDAIVVSGDARQLASALFNLVDNAVKYSPAGSEVCIEAAVPAHGDEVRLSVSDHGIGIPRGSMERVFERFYRVDRARSRNTGGTGLGLAIVRHVVSNHGGRVELSSTEGLGSTFTMVLPIPEHPGTRTRVAHDGVPGGPAPTTPTDHEPGTTGAGTRTGTHPRWIPS